VACCKGLTTEWFKVGSENRLAPNLDNLQLETIGEEKEQAFAICVLGSKSRIYLLRVIIDLSSKYLISRPRK